MEDKLKQGEALFAEGKIEEAEKCFLNLLEENPEDAEVLNNLGVIHHTRGNVQEAEGYFLKAIEAKEDYLDALLNLANLFQNEKRWKEAHGLLEKSILICKDDSNLYNQLGMVYLEMGDIEKAKTVLARSLELNPDQENVIELIKGLESSESLTKKPIANDNQATNKLIQHPNQKKKKPIPSKTEKSDSLTTQKQISLNDLFSSVEWEQSPVIIQNIMRSLIDQNQKLNYEISNIHNQVAKFANVAVKRTRISKQVVFVADIPTSRVVKLAYGLYQAGWQVILLHREEPWFKEMKYFSEIHRYYSPLEALNMAVFYNPIVYHVFSNMNYEVASTFIRHKPGKIVFDDYDVLAGTVKEDFARKMSRQIELERFCLENADGICCRSLDTQIAKHELKYNIGGRILFPEFCWGNIRKEKKHNLQAGKIKFCYVGNLRLPGNNDGGHHVELAAKLQAILKDRFSYDIYPSKGAEQLIPIYRETAKKQQLDKYMSFHSSLPYEELLSKLPMYDIGVMVGPLRKGGTSPFYNLNNKLKYGLANKVFDYIDCGLRILTSSFMPFQYKFIKRYWHILSLEDIDSNLNIEPLKSNSQLAISNHIERLELFYNDLN